MTSTSAVEEGSRSAPNTVVIFHGYTGSPDGFRDVAKRIARELNAHVTVPLLPGHGITLDDLQKVSFDDFITAARDKLSTVAHEEKPLVIIGYCFGGYLATLLAKEFQPRILVIALTPLSARFPLNIPGIESFLKLRSTWSKFLRPDEIEMRKGLFYYPRVPGRAQSLINKGIANMQKVLPHLKMPIITLHTTDDPTGLPESGQQMLDLSGQNPKNVAFVLPNRRHALFFGPRKSQDIEILIESLKKILA